MAGNRDFVLNNAESATGLTRDNHYVPQWYQKGFANKDEKLYYLDLSPESKVLPNGRVIVFNDKKQLPPSQCFFEYDLYTTFFGPFISDIFERKLFGHLDDTGARQ